MEPTTHTLWLEGKIALEKGKDGEVEMVIFVGPEAEKRAEEYRKWKKEHK